MTVLASSGWRGWNGLVICPQSVRTTKELGQTASGNARCLSAAVLWHLAQAVVSLAYCLLEVCLKEILMKQEENSVVVGKSNSSSSYMRTNSGTGCQNQSDWSNKDNTHFYLCCNNFPLPQENYILISRQLSNSTRKMKGFNWFSWKGLSTVTLQESFLVTCWSQNAY